MSALPSSRFVAAIGPFTGELRTRHLVGAPGGPQALMPFPQVAVIEVDPDGVYLLRYTVDGAFCGDTWHESIDDAKDQATFEYASALGPWYEVPAASNDPVEYAVVVGLVFRPEA